jgi:hypothetical protein
MFGSGEELGAWCGVVFAWIDPGGALLKVGVASCAVRGVFCVCALLLWPSIGTLVIPLAFSKRRRNQGHFRLDVSSLPRAGIPHRSTMGQAWEGVLELE